MVWGDQEKPDLPTVGGTVSFMQPEWGQIRVQKDKEKREKKSREGDVRAGGHVAQS